MAPLSAGESIIVIAARRRATRSSHALRMLLVGCLAFMLVAWRYSDASSSFAYGLDAVMAPEAAEAPAMSGPCMPGPAMPRSGGAARMPLRVVTLNIRYATTHPVAGEKPWRERCPRVGAQLRFVTAGHESPFVCLQEALHSQLGDVAAQLGAPWAHIGRGRDDGPTDGEFSPILFRTDAWRCTRNETRWLSPTPDRPSRGWDAALNRIVTMGDFTHRATGARVVVMSTHLDHQGPEARRQSARLLLQWAAEWGNGPAAVLIGGDFNSAPEDEAYRIMTARGSNMSDVASLVREERRYGNTLTYTSFGEPDSPPSRIDFLFIKEPRTARVETFGVLANSFDDGVRLSDHRAVVADVDVGV